MAKFRESGYVNDFVMFRNACEERKLKYTLSHIDKMKVSYNRQQDKEKLFFAVQHLSVPANRKFSPLSTDEATLSRSRSYSAPLQNDKVDATEEITNSNAASTPPPKNETLLTKRKRCLTVSGLPNQKENTLGNEIFTKPIELYSNSTKMTNSIRDVDIKNTQIQSFDDGRVVSFDSYQHIKQSSPNLPQVVENKLTKTNIARFNVENKSPTPEDQTRNADKYDLKYKNHQHGQQKHDDEMTQITINNKPITTTTTKKRNKNLLTVDFNGNSGDHHQKETSRTNRVHKSKQRFLSPNSDGSLSPLSGCSRRASTLSNVTTTVRAPSRHGSVYNDAHGSVYSDANSDYESSIFRSRLKEKQKEKELLRELMKRKKTVNALSKSLQEAQDRKGNENENIKRMTALSSGGLTMIPAKEEWQRKLETMKETNHDLTRREKQAIEERVRNRWKDAFEDMKSKRLSVYQSKMSISCGEENSKTFVKFLPKSKQAFYIKDVQFAQKFL